MEPPLPALTLNASFRAQLARKEPFVRVVKVIRNGEMGDDYQPPENLLLIPAEVGTPEFPLDELVLHAQRFGWPDEQVTLWLGRVEAEEGAMTAFLSQTTLQARRGHYGAGHVAPQQHHPAPQPYQPLYGQPPQPQAHQQQPQPPAANPDPLAGLSEVQRLTMEVTKLAAMAAGGGKRASVLDRLLSGEIGPDEAMGWLIKVQRLLPAIKSLITVGIKWVVPLVRETWEESKTKAEQDRAKTTKKPDAARSPEAAPPP